MPTKTFNDMQFIEVPITVFESHIAHWPTLGTYTLDDDKTVSYYHDKEGKVWALTQFTKQTTFYVRQEMYQPLLGTDAVNYRVYRLSEICKMLVNLDVDFEVETKNDIVRIFDRYICVARGTDLEMSLNPDYDAEHREAYHRLLELRTFLGPDYLESESTIFFTHQEIRIRYDV